MQYASFLFLYNLISYNITEKYNNKNIHYVINLIYIYLNF